MANVKNLQSVNVTVESSLDANIIKGRTYEGLPMATEINNGMVMIDNITIKNNDKGQLYCTIVPDVPYDDSIVVNNVESHVTNQNIHLSTLQVDEISNSTTHSNDIDKHITINDKNDISKINTHVLDQNIHINQEQVTNINLSINHVSDSSKHLSTNDKSNLSLISPHVSDVEKHLSVTDKYNLNLISSHVNDADKHLSISDKDNLNLISQHSNDSTIHVTQVDKTKIENKIANIDTHIINNNIHLSQSDRDDINTALSTSSAFPGHASNNNIHFNSLEKAEVLQKISNNATEIASLNELRPQVNNLAITKFDSKNHTADRLLITDNTGSVVYHPSVNADLISKAQMYKLTEDDGQIKYITGTSLDITKLDPGNYSCVSSIFINPPIPNDSSFIDINVRQNSNLSQGVNLVRKVITVHYTYNEQIFIGQKHNSYDYFEWKELEFKDNISLFYESEKETLYNKLINIQNDNTKSIGFITDTHYVKNGRGEYGTVGLKHMNNIIDFCSNGFCDLVVHGGDSINGKGNINDPVSELIDVNREALKSNIPIYLCKGNHDNGTWKIRNSTDKSYNNIINQRKWNNLISNKYVKKYGFIDDKKNSSCNYSYYDFNDVKLRAIFLDTVDHRKEDMLDLEGNVDMDTSTFCIGQKQIDWLINEALRFDVSSGWNVILFGHCPMYWENDISGFRNGYILHNCLKAFKDHTSYSATNTTSYGITASCDFSGTNHNVVASISGHAHRDSAWVKDFNYIICTNSCPLSNPSIPFEDRSFGTVNEDSWSIFTIDTATRKIHLNRFGRNKNFEQVIPY